MSRAINVEALIAEVNNLVDRGDELLAQQGNTIEPWVAQELYALGKEVEDLSFALAHAVPALTILHELCGKLGRRAAAIAEVTGAEPPTADDFAIISSVGCHVFGPRFGPKTDIDGLGLSDYDVPF